MDVGPVNQSGPSLEIATAMLGELAAEAAQQQVDRAVEDIGLVAASGCQKPIAATLLDEREQ